jgi:hypothetical protein
MTEPVFFKIDFLVPLHIKKMIFPVIRYSRLHMQIFSQKELGLGKIFKVDEGWVMANVSVRDSTLILNEKWKQKRKVKERKVRFQHWISTMMAPFQKSSLFNSFLSSFLDPLFAK